MSWSLGRRCVAESIGTCWLVLGGCGSAVTSVSGIGPLGVAIAFGLAVLTMAYALGPVSGAHFNPAVTVGLWVGGRFPRREVPAYVAAQVVGALIGGGLLYWMAIGTPLFDLSVGFAANGYGDHSPGHFGLGAAALAEVLLTCGFVVVIMGATDPERSPPGMAPLAIGFALTLVHLVGIPVTNTSVNPARSTGVALFATNWALHQLWLFWIAPLAGGAVGGEIYRLLVAARRQDVPSSSGALAHPSPKTEGRAIVTAKAQAQDCPIGRAGMCAVVRAQRRRMEQ